MKIELTRFKIKKGKTKRVDEWMQYIRNNIDAAVATLNDEKMNVEFIFREFDGENEYLYWSDCQGDNPIVKNVRDSKHELDKRHVEFSEECIDVGAPGWKKQIQLEYALIPDHIKKVMWQ